jgi:hypothetical protein
MSLDSSEIVSEVQKIADGMTGSKVKVVVERSDGEILEIEKVYFSIIGGGRIHIVTSPPYDEEFDPEDE